MRVLLQRVSQARVEVDSQTVGEIGPGLLLLAGFGNDDQDGLDYKIKKACDKLLNLRVFSNKLGKLDHSVVDIAGNILAVPQFTLYGKSLKGRRPDFTDALAPALASLAFERFAATLSADLGQKIETGVFGADMKVWLVNDGPLTLNFEF